MPKRILVVDDHEDMRKMIQALLEGAGYEVITTGSGREVFRLVNQEKPNLVVLDVMMPRMDGFEVLRNLKSNAATATTPVVFVTAKASDYAVTTGVELEATAYLTKPFDPDDLLALVQRILTIQEAEQTH